MISKTHNSNKLKQNDSSAVKSESENEKTSTPVSYTHLDVYKRQPYIVYHLACLLFRHPFINPPMFLSSLYLCLPHTVFQPISLPVSHDILHYPFLFYSSKHLLIRHPILPPNPFHFFNVHIPSAPTIPLLFFLGYQCLFKTIFYYIYINIIEFQCPGKKEDEVQK